MRFNDLIVSVNSQRVASVDDLHRLLGGWLIDRPMSIPLPRRRAKLDMTVLSSEAGASLPLTRSGTVYRFSSSFEESAS
jgi:hypothetical protein